MKQHIVPATYLSSWQDDGRGKGMVVVHDLSAKKIWPQKPSKALRRTNYYEDPSQAEHEVEQWLGEYETRAGDFFEEFADLPLGRSAVSVSPGKTTNSVRKAFSDDACKTIKEFAAIQYLRHPGAIKQKEREMGVEGLSAGPFTRSGFEYISGRFESMAILALVSAGQDFLTSDWPCYDVNPGLFTPVLGEDIGRREETIAVMPLIPRMCIIFLNRALFQSHGQLTKRVSVRIVPDSIVRNQNTMTIQRAERFVIARNECPFVFPVRRKRPSGSSIIKKAAAAASRS